MASTQLFAPEVRAIQPAAPYLSEDGSTSLITIYFSMPFNKLEDLAGLMFTLEDPNIKTSLSSASMIKEAHAPLGWTCIDAEYIVSLKDINSDSEECYFNINLNDNIFKEFTRNQYYHMQIKLIENGVTTLPEGIITDAWLANNNDKISNASQVTLIRPISQLQMKDNTGFNPATETWTCEFVYADGSEEEIIDSYYYELFEENEPLENKVFFGKSDWIQNQSNTGFTLNIDLTDFNLKETKQYTGNLTILTINGYKCTFGDCEIKPAKTVGQITNINITVSKSADENYFYLEAPEVYIEGIFQKQIKETSYWKTLLVKGREYYDYDIINGEYYTYRYYIQNENGGPADIIKTVTNGNSADLFFSVESEDIYLMDKDMMLIVKYNPNITNFKYVTQENITNTLGGRYPIIRKNADTKYRQFTLSGTIYAATTSSVGSVKDSTGHFIDMSHFEEPTSVYLQKTINAGDYSATYLEKKARDIVMEFLTNGQYKFFKSFEEGNMIVYLSNISFTPNKQLGRHVYDFSCTVTEVCDYNISNLQKYGLLATTRYLPFGT